MPLPNHINPDHYVDLENATAVPREAVANAWDRVYQQLEARLSGEGKAGTVYVVFGLQGSGKSTWIAHNAPAYPANAAFLDGPLPSKRHRQRALAICKATGCAAVAIWINTPFKVALERNARRKGLARIEEATIRHVRDCLEAPTAEEGFSQVFVIDSEASL